MTYSTERELLGELAEACEQLAVANPKLCGPDPAWDRLATELGRQPVVPGSRDAGADASL